MSWRKNMSNLDISKWKTFDFNKVFNFNRGKRLTTLDQTEGDIAYISSSKINNGIDNYITPPDYMRIYQNVLTINNSGSVGFCFYHPYKIVCSDHCTVITLKDTSIKMNPYIALFLKPIIESMKNKYSFAREISDYRLKKERIVLPSDEYGNPNWTIMQQYIQELSKKIFFKRETKKSRSLNLKDRPLKEFNLTTLFNVRGSKLSYTQYEINLGNYLYITTSNKNNGVLSTSDKFTEDGGVITIDSATDGKAFYQEVKFVGSDHVEVLQPIGFKLNRYLAMFFVTLLNFQRYRYSYGRKRAQKRINQEKIYLPYKTVKSEDVPDFKFMERYIKSLPYSSNIASSFDYSYTETD